MNLWLEYVSLCHVLYQSKKTMWTCFVTIVLYTIWKARQLKELFPLILSLIKSFKGKASWCIQYGQLKFSW